jgi:hypothetical protein
MRRFAVLTIVFTMFLSRSIAAEAPAAPPHSWLFGAWVGGMFPPPATLSTQECLSQPMVIFTRDVVMRATMTSPTYLERQISTVRATTTGFEFKFVPATPQPPETEADVSFGCNDPDGLVVQRQGENQIAFPGCTQFPFPLVRCGTH